MNHRPRAPNFYAGNYVDRLADRRQDEAWLRQHLQSETTRFVPLWQGKNLVSRGSAAPAALLLERDEAIAAALLEQELVFLGEFRGQICFAVQLRSDVEPALHPGGEFRELRSVGGDLDRDEAGLLGYARALLLWRENHRFCGRCGAPTRSVNGGHALKCDNSACGLMQFPRLDPAIIVLVTDGERALLGRQPNWPPGRYSTIAGYIEAGESIEEAVAALLGEAPAVAPVKSAKRPTWRSTSCCITPRSPGRFPVP